MKWFVVLAISCCALAVETGEAQANRNRLARRAAPTAQAVPTYLFKRNSGLLVWVRDLPATGSALFVTPQILSGKERPVGPHVLVEPHRLLLEPSTARIFSWRDIQVPQATEVSPEFLEEFEIEVWAALRMRMFEFLVDDSSRELGMQMQVHGGGANGPEMLLRQTADAFWTTAPPERSHPGPLMLYRRSKQNDNVSVKPLEKTFGAPLVAEEVRRVRAWLLEEPVSPSRNR